MTDQTPIDYAVAGVDTENDRGPWMATWTGCRFHPLDPSVDEIFIEDIARALSMQCRFNGHVARFYSIAEHSTIMSQLFPNDQELAAWALMHDAAEAYIGDMVKPLKVKIDLFNEIEEKIMKAICQRFGLSEEMPHEVKVLDSRMCASEKRDLKPGTEPWIGMPEPLPGRLPVREVPPSEAEAAFLRRFYDLFVAEGTA